MRILHAGNHQLRKYGYTRVSWTQKLFFGLIRNNHCVQPFSDRDVASHEAPLRIRELGKNATNKRLIQTAEAFEPDLLFVGHCDIIKNETLEKIRQLLPNVIIAGGNADPLFVPKNYKFDAFFKAMYHWHPIINKAKYANNYDYNKAVYLMSEFEMLENGFFMIKEDKSYASPIATLFYEYYEDANQLKEKLEAENQNIQCIVSKGFTKNEIAFGNTQKPQLWDYADDVDSIAFLLEI